MTRLVAVPTCVLAEIDAKLDAELEKHPDAAPDRELFRDQLINYVDEYGIIPDFSLERNKR